MIEKDIGEEIILKLKQLIRELEKLRDIHEKKLAYSHSDRN